MHTTLDRVFQCSQCEKGFKEMRTLRLHLKIHNAEYPEQCGVCQKVFRTKWQLKQHQMDHGGERPYPCPECSFTCKTKQQLNEHRRKHSVSHDWQAKNQVSLSQERPLISLGWNEVLRKIDSAWLLPKKKSTNSWPYSLTKNTAPTPPTALLSCLSHFYMSTGQLWKKSKRLSSKTILFIFRISVPRFFWFNVQRFSRFLRLKNDRICGNLFIFRLSVARFFWFKIRKFRDFPVFTVEKWQDLWTFFYFFY